MVQSWYEDVVSGISKTFETDPTYPWTVFTGNTKSPIFELEGMPEPYLGNPCAEHSVVILNFNPGSCSGANSLNNVKDIAIPDNFINQIANHPYSDFAASFDFDHWNPTAQWHLRRLKWVRRVLDNNSLSNPVMIEACPLHSASWNSAVLNRKGPKDYVIEHAIIPAIELVRNSTEKKGFVFGKRLCELMEEQLKNSGATGTWEEFYQLNPQGVIWPTSKQGKPSQRVYRRYKDEDITILCTWCPLDYGEPDMRFFDIERQIIK